MRLNFDQLRSTIPDLQSLEKASKLTILNKAAAFCRQAARDAREIEEETPRVKMRNQQLQRQLKQLVDSFNSSSTAVNSSSSRGSKRIVTTASGRVSVPTANSRHYY